MAVLQGLAHKGGGGIATVKDGADAVCLSLSPVATEDASFLCANHKSADGETTSSCHKHAGTLAAPFTAYDDCQDIAIVTCAHLVGPTAGLYSRLMAPSLSSAPLFCSRSSSEGSERCLISHHRTRPSVDIVIASAPPFVCIHAKSYTGSLQSAPQLKAHPKQQISYCALLPS